MLKLNNLHYFVAAVEHGGFAAASRHLGMPKSTISKHVADLEQNLGARLIQRTSRSFTLTEVGRDFYRHARAAMIETEAAEEIVRNRLAEPSGTVRVTASVPTAQLYLAENLPRLAQMYPKLYLQLEVSDRFVDIVQEGFDVAVRSHFSPLPDSGLIQRPVLVEPIILVAAPGYLKQRHPLQSPEQLATFDGLLSNASTPCWTLFHAAGQEVQVTTRPRMVANESTVLLSAATAGMGVVCLPERVCQPDLASGRLVRLLPEWNAGRVTTTLLMPHRRGLLPSVRASVDFLAACFGEG